MPKEKKKAKDLRADILEVAQSMFFTYGYESTTFQKIADELGISKGAITYHYKNKHRIVEFIFDAYFGKLRAFVDRYPECYKDMYWRSATVYIYAYRKIMSDPHIRSLFYQQEIAWLLGKVDAVYNIYKSIAIDFHKSFTHEELMMTSYMDLGARQRIYLEYTDNPELLDIDSYCHYLVYMMGCLSRLDEHTIRSDIKDAFAFANSHQPDIELFGR